MPVPPSLPRQAAAMKAYLNSLGASRASIIERRSFEKVLREKVDVVFDLIGGDTQNRSFLVLKEGGHLVAATQPVSQEETAKHRVSGVMMRLTPSGDVLGRIAQLLEEGNDSTKTSRSCTRSRMRPSLERHRREPARGSWMSPVGRERQDAGHTARIVLRVA